MTTITKTDVNDLKSRPYDLYLTPFLFLISIVTYHHVTDTRKILRKLFLFTFTNDNLVPSLTQEIISFIEKFCVVCVRYNHFYRTNI